MIMIRPNYLAMKYSKRWCPNGFEYKLLGNFRTQTLYLSISILSFRIREYFAESVSVVLTVCSKDSMLFNRLSIRVDNT